MQTILENLEETYLQLEQVIKDDNTGMIELDTANREAVHIAFTNTIKNIVLLLINETVKAQPMELEVYTSLIETDTFKDLHKTWQEEFLNELYANEILHKDTTIGELISKLQNYDTDCIVTVDGQKFIINDTIIGKPMVELKTVKA